MKFYNRKRELAQLDNLFHRPNGQLYVLYGRRRVGKTVLLTHWLETRKHRAVFWTADRTSAATQLRLFSQIIQSFIEPTQIIPPDFTYASWDLLFNELARLAQQERLVVVLDEFTYLLESDPGLASVLQRLWDHRLKQSNLLLILTGSHAGMIEREVLAYRSPLYNRATASTHLQPMPFSALAEFFPHYSVEERVTIYGLFGGVPQYFELFQANATLEENLQILLTSSMILDDAGALLRDQLSEPRNYVAIVSAIAAGYTRITEIALMAGLEHTNVSRYLNTLQHLGIVERQVPATEHRPEQSKNGRYRITDPYLRYYYRFIAPNRTSLERGLTQQAWANVKQHLAEFVGAFGFEELCREWVLRQGDAGKLPFPPRRIGAFWKRKGPQIDVVAVNQDEHAILLGECKWRDEILGRGIAKALLEKTELVVPEPMDKWNVYYAFFSKSGFTEEARREMNGKHTLWIGLEELEQGLLEGEG